MSAPVCHPEEAQAFALRRPAAEGPMHFRAAPRAQGYLHSQLKFGLWVAQDFTLRSADALNSGSHPPMETPATRTPSLNPCHPEEVQAFALRRPADEGSMLFLSRATLQMFIHHRPPWHRDAILSAGPFWLAKPVPSEGSMHSPRYYYVYILTNRSKTLYTGITSNLANRVFQHKTGVFPGFTSRYKLDRLVYYERFASVGTAIQREKQIKGLLRIKKMALIVSMNPEWKDLSEGWYHRRDKSVDPSPSLRSASGSG